MDTIKMLATTVCITAVITAIFSMLMPEGKLEKVVMFAVSVFFLIGIVTPFTSKEFRIQLKEIKVDKLEISTKIENSVNKQFLNIAKANLESKLEAYLIENNIKPQKIDIIVNISKDESISIKGIEIKIKKEDNKRLETIKYCEEFLKITPKVIEN